MAGPEHLKLKSCRVTVPCHVPRETKKPGPRFKEARQTEIMLSALFAIAERQKRPAGPQMNE